MDNRLLLDGSSRLIDCAACLRGPAGTNDSMSRVVSNILAVKWRLVDWRRQPKARCGDADVPSDFKR